MGRSPCIVAVQRNSEGIFKFELAGYETLTVDRNKVCNGATAFNLLGGWVTIPLFFAIDILSGNVGKYSTTPLHVKLRPVVTPPPPPPSPISGRSPPAQRQP